MNEKSPIQNRKEILSKMNAVFADKIESLPPVFRSVLLKDMVTTFENRLKVFRRMQSLQSVIEVADFVELDPI
jgi:hypothetical protein